MGFAFHSLASSCRLSLTRSLLSEPVLSGIATSSVNLPAHPPNSSTRWPPMDGCVRPYRPRPNRRSDEVLDLRAHVVSELLRSAARGVLGAMAMTGVRRVTTDLGLVRKPPPERIATESIPGLFARLAPEHPETVIELCHWG